jgi:hypothetical protein
MTSAPKTIQIFLPSGEPHGIRIAEITTRIFLAMERSSQVGRFRDENGTSGSRPHTPAPLDADCMEIFETGSTLFSTLGFQLFDPLATATEAENPAELFFCRSPGAGVDGKGLYTHEGFVVLAGSVGRLENVPSIQGTNDARVRERLIAAGVMEVSEAGTITFPRDHLFRSPSSAASALLGRTANGWREWKNAQGRTLSQVKRG